MKVFMRLFLSTVFLIGHCCYAGSVKFELVKTIGDDERDGYTLFGIADSVLGNNKDIFVLNAKGNFVSHFNWNGEFKQRIGQQGSGPGDFYFPRSLDYLNKKLYVLEKGNLRIAQYDLNTRKFHYYREKEINHLSSEFFVLKEEKFLGIFYYFREGRGRIGVLDKDFNIIRSFFDESPVAYNLDKSKYNTPKTVEQIARKVFFSNYSQPSVYVDRMSEEVLVSFNRPDNPIIFYVYNLEGKLLKRFSYQIEEKKYKFPMFKLEASIAKLRDPNTWPTRFELGIDCVAIYKEQYITFVSLEDFEKKEKVNSRKYCLIFDRKGVFKEVISLPKDLWIHKLSNGYFLGTMRDEDVEKLYIYKLKL